MNMPIADSGLKTRLKRRIKWPLIAVVSRLPDGVQTMLFTPWIRRFGERIPALNAVYTGCYRTHPIDRQLGTNTGGIYPPEAIEGLGPGAGNLPYMGSQPSIVRRALREIGDVRNKRFIDIGCGKGRPMLVATEFPFREVLGCDLAEPLVEVANANATIIARRFPQRTAMRAYAQNALDMQLPAGELVVFLFNPFGAAIMTQLLRKLEADLDARRLTHLTVVYIYPICAHVFDGSSRMKRHFFESVPYAADEIGYGTEARHDVVIWKSRER
jgi:SAM-dependent methyltransferase